MAECSLRHWPDNGGTPQRDSKPKAHWSQVRDRPLLRDLVEKGKPALNVCISILEHHLTTANLEHWEDLDSKAKSLLPKLEELLGSWDSRQRPLLVHAHRKGEAAELLIENLAGIVFLGTPHLRESNKPEWEKAAAILELRMLSPPKALSDENELRQLFHWSQDFEDLGLKARILSTTERKESKKKRGTKLNKWRKESLHIVVREILSTMVNG
ncbi:uncharacterized protein J4E92_002801 [Alternaria infectoria]|uniref:uncharacterized protein n=1 Tax=Alternaria infectoria TaxID=45303 RepID=UPI00221E509F|nr:uncharacterized protein J4E92_002801 [Alternaria infectoria]KAI4935510.1 hypothetical protein J4E92_002801 [Alternaria infectoria]